jgi:hypothetical protein
MAVLNIIGASGVTFNPYKSWGKEIAGCLESVSNNIVLQF